MCAKPISKVIEICNKFGLDFRTNAFRHANEGQPLLGEDVVCEIEGGQLGRAAHLGLRKIVDSRQVQDCSGHAGGGQQIEQTFRRLRHRDELRQ